MSFTHEDHRGQGLFKITLTEMARTGLVKNEVVLVETENKTFHPYPECGFVQCGVVHWIILHRTS